jgi:IPT/TIG domain
VFAAFTYDAPHIAGADVVDAAHGGLIHVTGSNFAGASTIVLIDTAACSNVSVVSDGALACTAPPGLVRTARLVVTVDGLSGDAPISFACPPGFYGAAGETCMACPVGAACWGGDADPLPLAGYTRLSRASFVGCVPPEACIEVSLATFEATNSFGNCAVGYGLDQCRSCVKGYYRKSVDCVVCPSDSLLFIVLFFVFLLCVGILAGWLNKKQYNLKVRGVQWRDLILCCCCAAAAAAVLLLLLLLLLQCLYFLSKESPSLHFLVTFMCTNHT